MMQWPIEIHEREAVVQLPRNEGVDPLPELVALELSLGQQSVHRIVVVFDAVDTFPIERLRRLNYRELAPGQYVKTIPTRRAVRFSITEKCNYKCFFCHEEGLEMDRVRHDVQEEQIFRLLDQLKALGYNDFTVTGGEPLLKWRQVLRYLDYMRQIDYLPDVKFVSNGRAMTSDFLRQLQDYPGRVRFNISMHSLDPGLHYRIVHQLSEKATGHRDDLARIQHNLTLLRAAGIPFKLNFVLLKGLNTAPRDILGFLDYALDVGAHRVKFLELLITKKLKSLYPYYYRLDALRDQLGDQLVRLDEGQRRTLYRYRDTPLEVELQSCTCSKGCNVCALNRDVNVTAELRYFPCFLHPEEGADLQQTPLSDAAEAGSAYIAAMASHYGDHSPIIIRDRYLTRQESFYYYEIALSERAEFLARFQPAEQLELERHRRLTEYYFSDGSPAFAAFEYVHKLAINSYDHHAMAILQQHKIDARAPGRIETAFEHDGQTVPSIDAYMRDMARNGFSVVLQADWVIDYYASLGQGDSALALSIGTTPGRASALVRCNREIVAAPCPLVPLTRTVPAWLAGV